MSTSACAEGRSKSVRSEAGKPPINARKPTSPLIESARGKKRAGKMSGAPARPSAPPIRVANMRLGRARHWDTKALSSFSFNCGKSTGRSSAPEEHPAALRPRRTELDRPKVRCAFVTQETTRCRASRRYLVLAGGTTTITLAAHRAQASLSVRCNRVRPCTLASALGWPKRVDSPAASTTTFKLGMVAFVAIIGVMNSSRVNLQHRPFLTPIWLTAGIGFGAFLFALLVIAIWIWGSGGSITVVVIPESAAAAEERLTGLFGAEQGPGRLDAIYASPRGRQTASSLASRLHIPLNDAPDTDAKALARRALHGGRRVLVVAPAALFPGVVTALSGAEDVVAAAAGEDGVAYVVTVPRIGHANLLRLNY